MELKIKTKQEWLVIAIIAGLASLYCLLLSGGILLGEGPHGPNGAITQHPSIVWQLPLTLFLWLALAICSIWAMSKYWK